MQGVAPCVVLAAALVTACGESLPADSPWVMPGMGRRPAGAEARADHTSRGAAGAGRSGPAQGELSAPSAVSTEERIRAGAVIDRLWWTDEVAAQAEAEQAGRHVLIDFWASWCPPCVLLDRRTFADPEVRAELRAFFVPVRLDVSEQTEPAKAQLRHHGIDSLPAVLVLSSDGREVDRIRAFIGPDALLARLRKLRARAAGK
ncbi:MAG: thioredoxin family protein [Deltaproteobacteria bacterium]|nr:thioredoxin family protein [Deltaproteobacteria bacterium]MBW2532405.1 thioredoxin family protein [Deltaproteobacteria bacterium]